MTKKEKEDWDKLYEYVKVEILKYDKNQSLSKMAVLKLKGLSQGKCIANNNIENRANYSYEIILYTFKICKAKIDYSIDTKDFKDEISKISYIIAIINNNINDVYSHIINAKKSKEKTENINTDKITHNAAEYKPEEKKVNNKFKSLW